MNKFCVIFFLSFFFGMCNSQNLIPNGGFEQFNNCPEGEFDSLSRWFNPCLRPYGPNNDEGGSPDPFTSCNTSTLFGVPLNNVGYQSAHSGNSYAGLVAYFSRSEFREYIEVPLAGTLSANSCYYFQMYVSLADNSSYSADTIGAYFSANSVSGLHSHSPFLFNPQIKNTNGMITDMLNWTLISGVFTAKGNEKYLIIGNFNDDLHTDTSYVHSANGASFAYFYIDDVMLTTCTGIKNETESNAINIYPNPFSSSMVIEGEKSEVYKFSLYDLTAQELLYEEFTKNITLKTDLLEKGIYYYRLRNASGVIKTGKIVKQ